MRFRLKTLFLATGIVAVATYLLVAASAKVAIIILSLLAGALFAALCRKEFPRSARLAAVVTVLFFCYFLSDGLLLALRPVVVRAASQDDVVRDEYFCIRPIRGMTTRNIVVVEGTFAKDTWLTADLYIVRRGLIQGLNGFTVGRSPNRLGEAEWMRMCMTLALADAQQSKHRITQLGVTGQTRGSGNGGGAFRHNIHVASKQAFPGTIERGQMRIVYVEGDREAKATPGMTIDEFAKANRGSYIVVIAGLER